MERKHAPFYGIKGKLISAVCMLLVAVIMVVSSTYAWFTLSTAPEVSGISTAIGANGALEIKLAGTEDGGLRNIEYGNIVDLSAEAYGLDNIVLLPSKLGALNGDLFTGAFLQYPTYGSDGRVGTTFGETQIGSFDGDAFVDDQTATGVRGVGSVSGLSPRQAAYRSASTTASTAMTIAKNKATASLNANGGNLANIVVKKALDSAGTATYTQEELGYLETIVTDLTTNVLPQIKNAYEAQLKALAASKALDDVLPEGVTADTAYTTISAAIGDSVTLDSVATNDAIVIDSYNIPVTEDLLTGIEAYIATAANVADAQTEIDTLQAGGSDTMSWANFRAVLDYLMDYDNVSVNGMSPGEISNDKDAFVNKVIADNMKVTVTMNSGAGVYADIADQCGDYQASIIIKGLTYGSITAEELGATMNTKATRGTNPYLKAALAIAIAAGEPEGSATGGTMTEMYGFILDLIFRTNAANSDLLLQTAPQNRIYENSSENDAIMGKGSTMTFESVNLAEFSNDQVKALMENIRIVFFTPGENNKVIAYAKLDISQAEITAEGVTAPMYLYNTVYKYDYTVTDEFDATTITTVYAATATETTTFYTDETLAQVSNVTGGTAGPATAVEVLVTEQDDAVITALAQNVDVPVSVLVYLDGESMENADVAATAGSSVTGSMNIQFSSSATLVPMEYGDLKEGAAAPTEAPTPGN